MVAKASLKFVRIAPRKVREVVNLLRGKPVIEVLAILQSISRGSKEPIIKLVNSAIANAKVKGLTAQQLFISKFVVDGASTWKRYRAASFGRAMRIRKRTSHINLELDVIK
ncbi:MAG: 50S ribosomal protein L22 [Candidatus Omnitrophica bacterium]|nr:50S ribosomal protein L22 [Candidatus Omnitrophota bacterium]